jgi:uncharacterized protein YggU (UPF0235/DUF167 family)
VLRLTVRAHPGARVERVLLVEGDTLEVWVAARPVEGQANAAIERAIAKVVGLRPRQVKIVGGSTSRRKISEIDLPGINELRERLAADRLRPL